MTDSITVVAQTGFQAASDPAGVVVVGFLFVVVVLALLAAVTSAMGSWFTKQAARDLAKAAEASKQAAEASTKATASLAVETSSVAPAKPLVNKEDPALMAVVAAAVHAVFEDTPHRVVSVRSVGSGWAQEGRRQIFSSHRVR
ncbi:MAG: OadG family transporter subunit [Verrucomicrobiota bacterium]